jgi:hypothetical protein
VPSEALRPLPAINERGFATNPPFADEPAFDRLAVLIARSEAIYHPRATVFFIASRAMPIGAKHLASW